MKKSLLILLAIFCLLFYCSADRQTTFLETNTLNDSTFLKITRNKLKTIENSIDKFFKELIFMPIYFDFDRYDLRNDSKTFLEDISKELQVIQYKKIILHGNCDERGPETYNYKLGIYRASSVKTFLLSAGIPENKISIISHGKVNSTKNIKRNHSKKEQEKLWQLDRNVKFEIRGAK